MPSDITGTELIDIDPETEKRTFRFYKGPIFGNLVLADEINRTPPKTQSALLEAMQEHRVTAGGHTYTMDEPFFVLATQNPIEQEGTYPLPEAQLDRFMFHLNINYPTIDEEISIVNETTIGKEYSIQKIVPKSELSKTKLRISLDTEIPAGYGLKSSSAISTAVAMASAKLFKPS